MDGNCLCQMSDATKNTWGLILKILFGVGILAVIANFLLPSIIDGTKSTLAKLKENKFGVVVLLYVALWVSLVNFDNYATKGFIVQNILLLAGLLALKKIIWAGRYVAYGFLIYFGVKFLKKLNLGKAFMGQIDKIKEAIKPA